MYLLGLCSFLSYIYTLSNLSSLHSFLAQPPIEAVARQRWEYLWHFWPILWPLCITGKVRGLFGCLTHSYQFFTHFLIPISFLQVNVIDLEMQTPFGLEMFSPCNASSENTVQFDRTPKKG